MSRLYRYCGINLNSQLPLPELEFSDSEAASEIGIRESRLGLVPEDLSAYGPNWAVGPNEGWWWLQDRVFFRVRPGLIEIEVIDAEDSLVRALLLEGPMVMAMVFEEIFCLNAAAVEHDGASLLFCGASGSGRSTAAARLVLQGGTLIADSLARIEVGKIAARVFPQGSGCLLWPDALKKLGLNGEDGAPIRSELLLRRVGFPSVARPQPISHIYRRNPNPLTYRFGEDGNAPTPKRRRFARFACLTAGRLWIDPAGRSAAHFAWCHGLAESCQLSPAPSKYFD